MVGISTLTWGEDWCCNGAGAGQCRARMNDWVGGDGAREYDDHLGLKIL
jgi:hypothetical protein